MNATLRATVLQEWRGLPQRTSAPDRWQASGQIVAPLLAKLGLKERLRENEILEAWNCVVGDFIAAHSAPVALRQGVLYVRVLQPSLHYELEQVAKSKVLRKLKQQFGATTIRDLRFRLG